MSSLLNINKCKYVKFNSLKKKRLIYQTNLILKNRVIILKLTNSPKFILSHLKLLRPYLD